MLSVGVTSCGDHPTQAANDAGVVGDVVGLHVLLYHPLGGGGLTTNCAVPTLVQASFHECINLRHQLEYYI